MNAMEVGLILTSEVLWEGENERRVGKRVDLMLESRIDLAHIESMYAVVNNLSQEGFAFSGFKTFQVESKLWIKLPQLEPREAIVVWDDNFRTGCKFVECLSKAEFDRALKDYSSH